MDKYFNNISKTLKVYDSPFAELQKTLNQFDIKSVHNILNDLGVLNENKLSKIFETLSLENNISFIDTFIENDVQYVEKNISDIIENPDNISTLSSNVKSIIFFVLFEFFVLPLWEKYIFPPVVEYVYTSLNNAISSTNPISPTNPNTIKKNLRREVPLEALVNYRLIIGHNVRLRSNPSLNSEIIKLLPRGSLLKTLDKSNKSWLFVEITIDDVKVAGWVSRRYTKILHFKKKTYERF